MPIFRKVFLLFLLLLPFVFNAQVSDTVVITKEITETERLVDKYGGQIISKFNDVIKAATPMAKEGFEMVVKLKMAQGFASLIPLSLFFLFSYLFYIEHKRVESILNTPKEDRTIERYEYSYGPMSNYNISTFTIIYLIAASLFFVISLFTTYTAIMYLLAPEWYAIKEIIQLLNPQQ